MAAASACVRGRQRRICSRDTLVHVDERADDGLALGRHLQSLLLGRLSGGVRGLLRLVRLLHQSVAQIQRLGELESDLEQRLCRPLSEPVDDAAVEQRGRSCAAAAELVAHGVHREHDVKVPLHLPNEVTVHVFLGVQEQAVLSE